MLKKYISKFASDILPSVLATIIGAYIVNHYIVSKPDAPAAAVASQPNKADPKPDAAADVAGIPGSGVKAKGVSEKAMLEKTAAERPVVADRPAETATLAPEPRHPTPVTHDKPAAKAVQTSAPAAPVAAVEPASAPEEKRDAAELARAAIERLRATPEPHQDPVRAPEPPRLTEAPKVTPAPAPQPLPPPIMVSTPSSEALNPTDSLPAKPSYASPVADPQRPTPPADIPVASRPLELRAEADVAPAEHTSFAEGMLSAAKTVFHAVLPR
jgi:hypothetical protein